MKPSSTSGYVPLLSDTLNDEADVQGKLVASGDIYKGTHSGWYSISDEAFYSPSQITKLDDGRVVATETGNEVFLEEEENWKFRLTGYKDRLRDWLSKSECTFTLIHGADVQLYGLIRIARRYFDRLTHLKISQYPDHGVGYLGVYLYPTTPNRRYMSG